MEKWHFGGVDRYVVGKKKKTSTSDSSDCGGWVLEYWSSRAPCISPLNCHEKLIIVQFSSSTTAHGE